jgi:hypothetical protein
MGCTKSREKQTEDRDEEYRDIPIILDEKPKDNTILAFLINTRLNKGFIRA